MKAKFKIGDWVKPKNGKEFKVGDIYYDIYDHYIKYLEKGCVVYHPEHLLEPVTDFRVGDTVEVVSMKNTDAHYWMKDNFIGTQGVIKIIRNHSEKFCYCEFTDEIIYFDVELKLITRGGSKMSNPTKLSKFNLKIYQDGFDIGYRLGISKGKSIILQENIDKLKTEIKDLKPEPTITIADLMKEVEDSMQALREAVDEPS